MIQERSTSPRSRRQVRVAVSILLGVFTSLGLVLFAVYRDLQEKAGMRRELSGMKSMLLSSRLFATDFEGKLPTGQIDLYETGRALPFTSSNQAWAYLYDMGIAQAPLYWCPEARHCSEEPPILSSSNSILKDPSTNYLTYFEGRLETEDGNLPVVWEVQDNPEA